MCITIPAVANDRSGANKAVTIIIAKQFINIKKQMLAILLLFMFIILFLFNAFKTTIL